MEKKTAELLADPPAEYRGKPFWAWNGELKKEELFRQIDAFRKMGFGGFFMHSRTGLKTEYLGDAWFALVRECALYAQKIGLEAWLYDEDRWPSGTCGGLVTEERKYRLRFLSLYFSEREARSHPEVVSVLYRYAVKLERDETGEEVLDDFYAVESAAEVREGYVYALFAEEEQKPSDFYNGNTYIDAMNPDATRRFLQTTHEKYAEYCGDLFGSAIRGIFTDEPYRGATFSGFGLANENREKMTPWTQELPEAYRKKYGRKPEIPLLFWRRKGELRNSEAEAYIDVMDDLFLRNFALPCQKWCKEHDLILTGHILHEDSLSVQANFTGSCMRYYEYMDFPGIDVLGQENRVYWAALQCSSVARQLGKKQVLSELYGATGWDMSLEKYKQIGDWQALFGINFRCPHLSMYTMEGEAKRDYPASILTQNAWYREWKYLEDYFARLAVLSIDGERVADTLVVTPVREMWGEVRLGWTEGLSPKNERARKLDSAYSERFLRLVGQGVNFDYGDEEILRKYGCVEKENGVVYLRVGKARYREVLWNREEHVGKEARALLEKFSAEGGLLTDAESALRPGYRFRMPENVGYAIYKLGGDCWCFVLNLDEKHPAREWVAVPEELKSYRAERWDFRMGKSMGRLDTERGAILLELCGGEECIWRFTEEALSGSIAVGEVFPAAQFPEEFIYELTEFNVLPLDEAIWERDGVLQNGGKKENILRIDRVIRLEKGRSPRGGEMLQPWFVKKKRGGAKSFHLCGLKFSFHFEVDHVPDTPVYLAKERNGFACRVNGTELGEKSGKKWVDNCFELYRIALRKGVNLIEFSGDFYEEEGLEAVYLLGDFGVKLPCTICNLPSRLKAGDIASQGLPFYSGAIRYHTGITGRKVSVNFDRLDCFSMKIHGGKEEKTIAFRPYRENVELESELVAETVFNRRNTFGPLHQAYPQSVCSPESFLTSGKDYTDFFPAPQGLNPEYEGSIEATDTSSRSRGKEV